MKTDRLTSLTLINIHCVLSVHYDEVARLFFQLHPQKNQSKNLVFQ